MGELICVPRCVGCNQRLPIDLSHQAPLLCPTCKEEWQRELRTQCRECFSPYCECLCQPSVMEKAGCFAHVKLAPYSDGGKYFVAKSLVLGMKRKVRSRALRFVAEELSPGVEAVLTRAGYKKQDTVITYLPRDPRRVAECGVDQARELALAISAQTGIKFGDLIARRGHTKAQKTLSAKQRVQNLKGVFSQRTPPSAPCVILVDDIVTTGAGMSLAVKLLREAGVACVIALSLAYTELEGARR